MSVRLKDSRVTSEDIRSWAFVDIVCCGVGNASTPRADEQERCHF